MVPRKQVAKGTSVGLVTVHVVSLLLARQVWGVALKSTTGVVCTARSSSRIAARSFASCSRPSRISRAVRLTRNSAHPRAATVNSDATAPIAGHGAPLDVRAVGCWCACGSWVVMASGPPERKLRAGPVARHTQNLIGESSRMAPGGAHIAHIAPRHARLPASPADARWSRLPLARAFLYARIDGRLDHAGTRGRRQDDAQLFPPRSDSGSTARTDGGP